MELIKTELINDRITLSARDLYDVLDISTNFKDWFPRMCEYGFEEGRDFNPLKIEQVRNEGNREVKREISDAQITIDMAKEIAMIQRSDKGRQIRKYFIAVEKEFNTPERIMARGLEASRQIIEDQNKKLMEMKPKADFFDQVADSKTAITMDEVAKVLAIPNLGRNNLFALLRSMHILQINNVPYQEYVDRGYFRVIEQKYNKPSGEVCISIKTLVYQKGISFIHKMVTKEVRP